MARDDVQDRIAETARAMDTELLAMIAGGDQSALNQFFMRHRTGVFRFIARLTRNEAVAEELTNETFLEVWRHANRFEGRSSPSTWLLSIARNRTISALRKRREETWDETAADRLEDDRDTPDITAQKTDKAALLRQCIAALSPEHAEVIGLVYYQEKSVAEVSEITGVAEATVKTRMFYARKKLSEILKENGVDRGWP
ncbi:MAG: sigma-70 family RNA polymerase sigma factor [Planctomycetota bacterium]